MPLAPAYACNSQRNSGDGSVSVTTFKYQLLLFSMNVNDESNCNLFSKEEVSNVLEGVPSETWSGGKAGDHNLSKSISIKTQNNYFGT